MLKAKSKGRVILPPNVHVWKHELRSAQTLANFGWEVTFLAVNARHRAKTADILLDDVAYELKSPRGDKLSSIERNLKRATKQSNHIVIDSYRVKSLPDDVIQAFLIKKLKEQLVIKELLFINRKRQVIDIRTLTR